MQIEYAKMLKWFYHNHPNKIDRFIESVSENQQKSKEQLFFGLKEKNGLIENPDKDNIFIEQNLQISGALSVTGSVDAHRAIIGISGS